MRVGTEWQEVFISVPTSFKCKQSHKGDCSAPNPLPVLEIKIYQEMSHVRGPVSALETSEYDNTAVRVVFIWRICSAPPFG